MVNELPNNLQAWTYKEKRLQSQHKCDKCRCKYDILGDYGVCPACGKSNFISIINAKLNEMMEEFKEADESVKDRPKREIKWEKLTRCVSEFEALANRIREHMLCIRATPARKSDLSKLNFQNITTAVESMKNWYGFDIFTDISQKDQDFLNKMFNRRHVFTHNAGRVDQKYINNTGDKSVLINQVIRFRSNEIKRFIPLVRVCAVNFIEGFESLD